MGLLYNRAQVGFFFWCVRVLVLHVRQRAERKWLVGGSTRNFFPPPLFLPSPEAGRGGGFITAALFLVWERRGGGKGGGAIRNQLLTNALPPPAAENMANNTRPACNSFTYIRVFKSDRKIFLFSAFRTSYATAHNIHP